MSILSSIKTFTMELLGIENSQTDVVSQKQDSSSSVIECSNIEKPIDILTIQNKKTPSKTESQQGQSVASLKQLIENKCRKYNIDYQVLLKSQLMKNNDIDALKALDKSLDKLGEAKANSIVHKDVNIEQATIKMADIAYRAIKQFGFERLPQFYEAKNKANGKLGKDFSRQDKIERRKRLKNSRAALHQQFMQEYAELKKLPKEERKVAEEKLREKYGLIRQAQFNDVLMKESSEASADAIILLDAEDIDYGAQTLLETRASKDVKTRTADYMDYEFTSSMIADYKELGDEITGASLQKYSSTIVSNKSESAVKQYQEAYVQDRKNYEVAFQKKQRGEQLTAEEEQLLYSMKSEYYTATAQGIVLGVVENYNISTAQKAEMLANMNQDAKQFADYEIINQSIEKSIEKKKDLKESFEKSIVNKQENVIKQTRQKEKTIASHDEKVLAAQIFNNNKEQQVFATNIEKPSLQTNKKVRSMVTNPYQKVNANPIEIQNALNDIGDVREAFKKYDKIEVIKIVLSDTKKFKEHMPTVIEELKAAGKTTLIGIVSSSSDSVVTTLCEELGKEKIEPLLNRKLCYTAREKIENLG